MTTEATSLQSTESSCAPAELCSSATDSAPVQRRAALMIPRADIFATETDLVALVDMPGVDEDSIEITVEKNILTINGTAQIEPPPGLSLAYSEYRLGEYQRRFSLPNEIDKDLISAGMKDGVLKITLPKSSRAAHRKITVKPEH